MPKVLGGLKNMIPYIQICGSLSLLILIFLSYFTFQKAPYFSADIVGHHHHHVPEGLGVFPVP